MRPLILDLGSVGGEEFGRADRMLFTLDTWFDRMPGWSLGVVLALPLLASVLVAIASIVRCPPRTRPTLTLIGCLAVACIVVFLSALLGDGYWEFQKHTQLFFSLWCSLIVVVVAFVIGVLGRARTAALAGMIQSPPAT